MKNQDVWLVTLNENIRGPTFKLSPGTRFALGAPVGSDWSTRGKRSTNQLAYFIIVRPKEYSATAHQTCKVAVVGRAYESGGTQVVALALN